MNVLQLEVRKRALNSSIHSLIESKPEIPTVTGSQTGESRWRILASIILHELESKIMARPPTTFSPPNFYHSSTIATDHPTAERRVNACQGSNDVLMRSE